MKANQRYSPKFWIGHDKQTDDVIIGTGTKSFAWTENRMKEMFGEDWMEDENLEIILVEVNLIWSNELEQQQS